MTESGPLYTKEQEDIRKALAACDVILKDDTSKQAPNGCSAQASCVYAPDPHQLVLDRLSYHRKAIRELDALYNALPRTLSLDAANALAQVLLEARPRY